MRQVRRRNAALHAAVEEWLAGGGLFNDRLESTTRPRSRLYPNWKTNKGFYSRILSLRLRDARMQKREERGRAARESAIEREPTIPDVTET